MLSNKAGKEADLPDTSDKRKGAVEGGKKLRHAHIVQLIGTYRQGRKFAAILYSVVGMDLAVYLEEVRYMLNAKGDWTEMSHHERVHQDVLSKGSLCLVSALR
jgi:hypothetical protein